MSDKALKWAHEKVRTDDSSIKLLVLVMGIRADHKGSLWPSQSWLMERTGMSASTVKRTIRKMKKAGMVVVSAKHEGKHKTVNRYQLAIHQQFTIIEGVTMTPSNSDLKGSQRPVQTAGKGHHDPSNGVTMTPNIVKGTHNNITGKYYMYVSWQPDDRTVNMLDRDFGIPAAFTVEQLPVFVMYWIEQAGNYDSRAWQEKFIAHAQKNWDWHQDTWQPSAKDKHSGREWAQ